MLTAITNIYTTLLETMRALTSFLNIAPYILIWLSTNKIDTIDNEILTLESAADPNNHARLGQLRLQKANAGEFHALICAKFTAPKSGV
jgi:hypothetical protein